MQTLIDTTFKTLRLGGPLTHRGLTFFPLIGLEPAPASEYLVLDRALAEGLVRIGEISEGGAVPQLQVENLSDLPVLLVDGEELVGARQNRVLNTTLLVAPHSVTLVPVSCVEQGRWGYRPSPGTISLDAPAGSERLFQTAERVHFARGRAEKMRTVSESRRSERWESDQRQVWDGIAFKCKEMGVESDTHAMSDVFESQRSHLDGYVGALGEALPEQRGVVVAVGGVMAGLELFDGSDTYRCLAPKIVRSYALDALKHASSMREASRSEAEALVAGARSAEAVARPSVGLGTDVRFESGGIRGAALEHRDRLVHLAGFSKGWA